MSMDISYYHNFHEILAKRSRIISNDRMACMWFNLNWIKHDLIVTYLKYDLIVTYLKCDSVIGRGKPERRTNNSGCKLIHC